MKKKISIILLLFTIFLSSITYVDEVWGADYVADVKSTDSGGTSGCKYGNCYTMGTNGARFTLVDEKGNRVYGTETVDLWYYSNDDLTSLKYFSNAATVYFKKGTYDLTRNTLPNFNNVDLDSNILSVGNEYTMQSIDNVFPGILADMTNRHSNEGYACGTEKYCESDKKMNTRVPNVTETIMKRIENNANKNVGYLDGLYERIGISPSDVKETYFLQVEPLVQWGNYYLMPNNGADEQSCIANPTLGACKDLPTRNAYIFFGTTSELTLLFYKVNVGAVSNGLLCRGTLDSSGYCNGTSNRAPFNNINGYVSDGTSTNYYGIASFGVYAPKTNGEGVNLGDTTPGGKFNRIDDEDLEECKELPSRLEKWGHSGDYLCVINDKENKKAYGVGFISLKDAVKKSCHSEAYNILTTKYKNKFDKKNEYYLGKGEDVNAGGDLCSIKEIADECCTSGKLNGKCQQLSPEYLGNVGILVDKNISENNNLCKKADCDTIVGKINSFYSKDEATKSDKYYSIINYLFEKSATIFNSEQRGLNPIIWQFYGDKATCNRTIPPCSPGTEPVKVNCSNGIGNKTFSFKDSSDIEGCIKHKIAYNNRITEAEGVPNVIESSKDDHYSSELFGDVYCYEQVDFEFPNGGQTAVAGTVFKWGINIDKSDNVFGTMKVTRTCYLSDKFRDGTTKTFDSYWVWDDDGKKEIDPTISIKYKQAKNHDLDVFDVNTSLGIRLREYDSYTNPDGLGDKNRIIYKKDGTLDTTEIKKIYPDIIVDKTTDKKYIHDTGAGEKNNNPRTITCKTNDDGENTCANIEFITTTATYDIFYKDDLKWFSDKSLNGELITIGAEGLQPSYTFAGYGLPTSYPNPHNEICKQWGESPMPVNFNNTNGELKIYVSNVGTNGHFNNLIESTDLLLDDDNADAENVNYYCDYKIKNKLFDNEYDLANPYMCDPSRTPKGIDIVFRTVDLISSKDDLSKVFPGRSGSGREMGANWDKFSDESIADLLGDNVYNQEPMYEITLDSPTIQTIREWNNNARAKDIDPYTYMGESEASDASDDSYGFTGYEYYTITKNFDGEDHEYSFVASKFLEALDTNFEHFKTNCIISVGNTFTRRENCNQSWWKEGLDKHTISMELRTPVEG